MWTQALTILMLCIVGYYFYQKYKHWMNHVSISKLRTMKLEVEREFKLVANSRLAVLNLGGGYGVQRKMLVKALDDMAKLSLEGIEAFKRGGKTSMLIYLIARQWLILAELVTEGIDAKATDERLLKVAYLADLKGRLHKDSGDDINANELIKGIERDVIRYFS